MNRFVLSLSVSLSLFAPPVQAREPVLNPPLDCDFATSCFIPRFVDVDPSPGVADFMCGPLAGDGHKGTDFAVPTLAEMNRGVPVYPAAPGTVRAVRDGEPDTGVGPGTAGRECGNGVVIGHGDGWETQYCHLKNGSVAVQVGQRVGLRTVLGAIGLSGQTSFPHVHLSVRRDGEVIDPFAPAAMAQCGPPEGPGLWQDAPPYRPGGLVAAGFWDAVPEYSAVQAGAAARDTLPSDATALVIWGYAFGGRIGDSLDFTIEGPEGTVLSRRVDLDRAQALYFRAVGNRAPPDGWPQGDYAGRVTLLRGGTVLESRDIALTVGG